MICPAIQKDIVDACAKEIIKAIIQDLDDYFFGILVDESKDISHKEQMTLVIRYVNKRGEVIERFLDIVHVNDTSALSLQKTIYDLLLDHSLSSSKLRGQGYDGATIDLQLHELNNRFDVVTSDLLLGMASLNPIDSFANFDKDRIMKLAEYYPSEFDDNKLRDLRFQLDSFIVYAQMPHSKFINLKGMKDLAIVMAETKLDQTWCHIYLLVKLTLILPVATASVERAFSSMKLIKSDLRNSISEEFLNGCLVCNIERKVFAPVNNDAIIDRFQSMKTRRVQL
ncbi:PREDICTED: uncharacterized protein LOC109220742 [Nicotiana attenuata]|uniref:uncharacterized protein LOC109220742 n=1 Tax=Nicotiana attenuata TaxID=49451 RepID=UPI000905297D|nr:PREDICTED: uncharacterized protein LOC109220742 [Nicotiana attenuata]